MSIRTGILPLLIAAFLSAGSLCGCLTARSQPQPAASAGELNKEGKARLAAPTPEEAKETLKQSARKWFYGNGLGRTMLNIGTVVIFPPYALYLLANAGIELSGYEPLYMTDALPEDTKSGVLNVYDGVTSVPGRLSSAVAGEEFYGD